MGTADEQRGGGWSSSQGVSAEGGSAGEKPLLRDVEEENS